MIKAHSVFTLALLLTGCSGSSATTNTQTAPTSTLAGSETPATTATGDADAAAPTEAPADVSTPMATVDVPSPSYPAPANIQLRPRSRPPRGTTNARGRTEWTVVVAADVSGTPALQAVFTHATQTLRLGASIGEVRCSPPVSGSYPATIPTGDGAQTVSVHFATEALARQFTAALVNPELWMGQTSVLCADYHRITPII